MLRFISEKVLQCLFVVWATYTVTFLLIHALPGDPVLAALAVRAGDAATTDPEVLDALRVQYGMDGSLLHQYFSRFFGLFTGDLGTSMATGYQVSDMVARALPRTAIVALVALVLGFIGALFFTVVAYLARPQWLRTLVSQIPPLGIAIPAFLTGVVLISVFSFQLGWFPASGASGFETVVLPAVALSLPTGAVFYQVFSASVFEASAAGFVRTAEAKGLSRPVIIGRHIMRNAVLPSITIIGIQIGYLAGGTAVIETVFSRDGIGRMTVDAVLARDINVVTGVVIVVAAIYAIVTMLVDLLYGVLDPRIRTQVATPRARVSSTESGAEA